MNPPRGTSIAYIDLLVAPPRIVSATAAARVQPRRAGAPAHDGITRNEHFRAMLLTARERGFTRECVLFDSWYASIDGRPLGGMRREWHRVRTGIRWGRAKDAIIRPAVRRYLLHPWYRLPATAYVLSLIR